MEPLDCWRVAGPILLDLGITEPTLLRKAEPPEMGDMFRAIVQADDEWFAIAEDLGRFIKDHKLLAVALLRVAAVRLVGT